MHPLRRPTRHIALLVFAALTSPGSSYSQEPAEALLPLLTYADLVPVGHMPTHSSLGPMDNRQPKTLQLRIFTINRGKLEEFVRDWLAGVYPLRQEYGFTNEGVWIVEGRNRFVWLLSYPGNPEDFESQNAAYYDSEDRKRLQPDPARYIADAELWFINPVRP